jgi:mRNA interferase HicA
MFLLTFGLLCPNMFSMNGAEFIRKVKAAARSRGLACSFDTLRGKGSHGTLYMGDRFTIVKDRRKELGPGLLASMLSDLGLEKGDIQ